MATLPSKLDRGPLISVLKGWRQRLPRNPCSPWMSQRFPMMTPVDSGNKSVKKLGVYQALRLEVKPCHWDWVRHNRERLFSGETWLQSSPEQKTKHIFQGFLHKGGRQKEKEKKKKGKMLISLLRTQSVERFMWFCPEPRPVPSSCSSKGSRREVQRKKITLPGFMFYWKEALDELNSTWSTGVRHWKYLRTVIFRFDKVTVEGCMSPRRASHPQNPGCSNAHVLLAELIQWTAAQSCGFQYLDEAWSLIHELYSLFPPSPSGQHHRLGYNSLLILPCIHSYLSTIYFLFCFLKMAVSLNCPA